MSHASSSKIKQCLFLCSVLLQLASEALPNDMTLALAYLLALPQVSLLFKEEGLENEFTDNLLFIVIVYFTSVCLSISVVSIQRVVNSIMLAEMLILNLLLLA